jgi:hypothetical protein
MPAPKEPKMRKVQLFDLLKEPFRKPSPLELIAAELDESHREKLTAETAVEYAQSIVDYNVNRIARLNKRLDEYRTGE